MLAGVLGRLALGVVEVGRDGDHRLLDLLAEVGLGVFLHLLQDEGRDLLGRIVLAVGAHPGVAVRALDDLVGHHALVLGHDRIVELAADQALDGEEGVGGIGDRLALGRLADQPLAVILDGRRPRAWCARPRRSRSPSAVLPSMMATHELVVPRSMPIILLMTRLKRSLVCGGRVLRGLMMSAS